MIVGKAIYYLLTNATGVTDIVSTRVYPEVAQQDAALPYIVYNVANNEPTDTKPEPSKLDTAQVEVNIYSDSYTEAIDLAVAVRAALDRVKGTYNGVNVQSIQYLNEIIDFDEPQRAYNINADYDVRISRSGFEIAQGSPITGVELGELSDVNVAGVADGNALVYDQESGDWIPGTAGSALIAGAEIDITEVNGFSIISVEPDLAVTTLTTTGQGTIGGNFIIGGELRMTGATPRLIRPYDIGGAAGELIIQSNGNLIVELDENSDEDNKAFIIKNGADVEIFRVDESGVVTVNQAFALPTADGTANQLLKTDGSGTVSFGANLQDLDNVSTLTPSGSQVLTWSSVSGEWQPATPASPPPAVDELNDLSDVTIATPAANQILRFTGSVFSNQDLTQYYNRYATEAETLRAASTATVELYYTAQADGDGYAESAESDTPATGYDIRRKLYYSEAGFADPDTGTWVQFADIADDTTFASAKATLLAYLKERTGGTVPISLKMTWEEVAEAPSFTGLLNESYGSGAAAAYSVRRLNGLYTGAAIEVERSSDNTTQDIGFDVDGNLDESALTTFCTGTTCKVRTWYDQSVTGGTGSGNDAQQTDHTKQPTIYTGGAIVKENGRVAVDFDGTNDELTGAAYDQATTSFVLVQTNDTTTSGSRAWGVASATINSKETFAMDADFSLRYDGAFSAGTLTPAASTQYLRFAVRSTSAQTEHVNSVQNINDTQTLPNVNGTIKISNVSQGGTHYYDGKVQEAIIYASDKSTDRTSIESNIGDYFTQNTPLLDTYTGAAAAYSLRKLRTAYTGNAVTVRRASDNFTQGIGFNVFGELDTVSLAAFCGASDGFVDTWHDQSGNGNDATQGATANQPKIYDSVTGVVTEGSAGNEKPAVEFDGSNDAFDLSLTTSASDYSFFAINKADTENHFLLDSQTGRVILDGRGSATFGVYYDGSWKGTRHSGTTQQLQSIMMVSPSSGASYVDGSQINTGLSYTQTALGGSTVLGSNHLKSSLFFDGTMQEFLIYNSDQSANRTNIESNINTFYSIY